MGPTSDPLTVGWIGVGIMGEAMCTRLLNAGHSVVVWNRTASKCAPLEALGAMVAASPSAVVAASDLVFGMLADPPVALAAATGPGGVVEGVASAATAGDNNKKKIYVDMSTVDADTSAAIGAAVERAGGVFLEAPVSGSKGPAQTGQLVIMAAGSKMAFDAAEPYFGVMGRRALHLSEDVGAAARMKLVVSFFRLVSSFGVFSRLRRLSLGGGGSGARTSLLFLPRETTKNSLT
jgi:3-hydroxyisobutyrate dehydrogenase-like beta-hydroxyacid dehydrogenase